MNKLCQKYLLYIMHICQYYLLAINWNDLIEFVGINYYLHYYVSKGSYMGYVQLAYLKCELILIYGIFYA